MTTHTISLDDKSVLFPTTETLCGIKCEPLRFISYMILYKLHTVEDPCVECMKIIITILYKRYGIEVND